MEEKYQGGKTASEVVINEVAGELLALMHRDPAYFQTVYRVLQTLVREAPCSCSRTQGQGWSRCEKCCHQKHQ